MTTDQSLSSLSLLFFNLWCFTRAQTGNLILTNLFDVPYLHTLKAVKDANDRNQTSNAVDVLPEGQNDLLDSASKEVGEGEPVSQVV